MNRLTSLVRRYPVASIAVVVAVAAGGFLLLSGRPQTQTGGAVVTPTPVATAVTPAPAPTGQPTPIPAPTPVVAPPPPPAQAAGRADPFAPLVRAQVGGAAPPPPANLPPPPPLPPPLFPGPGASPGVPGAVPSPGVVRLSAGAQLIGVLGDTGKVAIIKIGNDVFIVAQGEMIQNKIRVEEVDANAGLVVLIEEGERIELRFG